MLIQSHRFFRLTPMLMCLSALSFTSHAALACECAPPPPACQAIGQAELVFLGTVTELNAKSEAFKTAKMQVDRAYKGKLRETVELFDDGMCDGPVLEVGHQYLMYTSGLPTGALPARGCTRSRRVEDADEDLRFLRQYTTGKVTTHISGTVRFRPDEPDDSQLGEEGRTPIKDVRVTLSRNGKDTATSTDALGRYSFSGLSPGEYEVDAQLSGYRLNWAPDSLTLRANGCAQADMLMKIDRRVEGIVRDDKGGPAPGVLVEMASTNSGLKSWEQAVLLSVSDEEGRYAIDGIPPGEYLLGVNIKSTPTKEYPFHSTYYPDTKDVNQATRIIVTPGASIQTFDLRVSNKLPLINIHGRVLNADGTAPLAQDHPQVRIKEPGLQGQIEQTSIIVDAEGRFQFELCDGVQYSAFAFSGPVNAKTYSAPIEFVPTKAHDQLELVLGKTPEEFRKLGDKDKAVQ
jgi:hypothetical protein